MDGPSRAARVRVSRVGGYQARRRHGTGKEQERTDRDELRLAEHVFTKQGTHHVGQLLERSPSRRRTRAAKTATSAVRPESARAGCCRSSLWTLNTPRRALSPPPAAAIAAWPSQATAVTTEAATSAHLMKLRE